MTRTTGAARLATCAGVPPDLALLATSALLFLASAAGTILWCGAMPAGMPMPGGWTMSMAWMRMPGQTWLGAFTSFLGMWILMMAAMMLPSLVPMLAGYRRSLSEPSGTRLARLTALAGAGYFFVWALVGAATYPLGVLLGAAAMRGQALARAVPVATGGVLVIAGCVQLSGWKARRLGCCRDAAACSGSPAAEGGRAWGHGLRLGLDCSLCCSGLMAVLLVLGVMDVGVMALVAAAITVERLAPNPERTARAVGLTVIAAGAVAIGRALGQV
jgi:predicted metal-binding membrane protein